LTKEEYNQWCLDTKRGNRMITTDMRFNLFCKAIKSDPSQGLSLDGLIGLYARPDQQGKVSPVLRGNFLAVTSCFIVCVRALADFRAVLHWICLY